MTKQSNVRLQQVSRGDEARERVSLGIGEIVVTQKPTIVRTVLGSCVAVIFHVPRMKISAVCHAQMPEKEAGSCASNSCPRPCAGKGPRQREVRHVTCCIRYMLRALMCLGVNNKEIVATLVGGANVLRLIDPRWSVADRNVQAAKELLELERIPIVYRDTGGNMGRVIEHISDLNHTNVRYHGR